MENNADQQFENPTEESAKSNKVLKITLAIVVVALLVVVGYFFLFLIPQPVVAPSQEVDSNATSKENLENVAWQTYRNEEIGVAFSYPRGYEIILDEMMAEDEENNWHRIQLKKIDGNQEVYIRVEVNAYGYGIGSPDFIVEMEEDENGHLVILNTRKNSVDNEDDSYVSLIPETLESRNGNYYNWIMTFNKGEKDFTGELKDVLETFKFIPSADMESWQTYRNEEIGVIFSYPSDYRMINDAIRTKYVGHPQGFNWYKVELEKISGDQSINMTFEADADGYGPFFPDKTYKLLEESDGSLTVTDEYIKESEYSSDGRVLIIPEPLEANNGHRYSWRFSFSEGEQNFEQEFKDILETFKFIQ